MTVNFAEKYMTSGFWDMKGILLIDYLPNGQTINVEYYANLLQQLKRIGHDFIP